MSTTASPVCWPVRVRRFLEESDEGKTEVLAEFDLLVVHDDLAEELGENVWECMDADSGEAEAFATLVWTADGEMQEPWETSGPMVPCSFALNLGPPPRLRESCSGSLMSSPPRFGFRTARRPHDCPSWQAYGFEPVGFGSPSLGPIAKTSSRLATVPCMAR